MEHSAASLQIPEQGQLVRVRNRFWPVEDVVAREPASSIPPIHRVSLECLDDHWLGERLDVT